MRRNVSVDSSLTPDILNIQVSNKSKNLTLTKSTNIIYKTTNGDELYLALYGYPGCVIIGKMSFRTYVHGTITKGKRRK
jgi:hypothetical protein